MKKKSFKNLFDNNKDNGDNGEKIYPAIIIKVDKK
jgi:hypothetical protein